MHPRIHRLLWLSAVLFLAFPAHADERRSGKWDGLKEMMSAEEFRAAGLDKLSPEELTELDQWLIRFLAYDAQQVVATDENIRELQQAPVRRRIQGHFSGWSGDTVFRLDNGEVWRQRHDGRYAISLENPEVVIKKNLFGFWELEIVETGRRVGVSRVR